MCPPPKLLGSSTNYIVYYGSGSSVIGIDCKYKYSRNRSESLAQRFGDLFSLLASNKWDIENK